MEIFDALLLARIQFAFTISFHIIFPAFTIGLASYLAVLEWLWFRSNDMGYLKLYRYWSKIFALSFGMGVVSGLVMSFQFGTNWSEFSYMTGPILGPLIGYEVLTAFFLEAGFLAIMLFGWNRVGPKLHLFSTCAVAFGTFFSSFWILSASSWMNTPTGHVFENGQFVPDDWLAIIFSPSMPYRFAHMVVAAFLTTSFVVGAVSALHLLRDSTNYAARTSFSMAMWMALLVAPVQLFIGDLHGMNTLKYQPAKVAAMEGYFQTRTRQPLYLFGMPNMETAETENTIALPGIGSLILGHDYDAEIQGLDAFPREEWPNVPLVFWSFRIMAGIGLLMILTGLLGGLLRLKNMLYSTKWFLRLSLLMGPSGFIAVIAGWFVTEIGRQPWTVYGLLTIPDSVTPSVSASSVGTTLVLFVVGYGIIFGMGMYYLLRLMGKNPNDHRLMDVREINKLFHTKTVAMTDRHKDTEPAGSNGANS